MQTIDVDPELDSFQAADLLAEQWEQAGPTEIALRSEGAFGVELNHLTPAACASQPFTSTDTFLITGGARGITAACAVELARVGVRKFLLLGRTPLEEVEDPELACLVSDQQISQYILSRSAQKPHPRELRKQMQAIRATREVRENLASLRALGAAVEYLSADLREPTQWVAQLRSALQKLGPVTGVVHGAGILADKKFEDLTYEEFANVVQTKLDGLQAVLSAVNLDELRWLAIFSSSTARFGRIGQAAYAFANEALNKLAQEYQRKLPRCVVRAFNWGPWAGGMVNEGLAKVFAAEGVGLIPLEAGAKLLVNELSVVGERPVELVVLAPAKESEGSVSPLIRTIDPAEPELVDHRLANRPVVPLAVSLGWCLEAANRFRNLQFRGFSEVHLLKGIVLEANVRQETRCTKTAEHQDALSLLVEQKTPEARWRPSVSAMIFFGPQPGIPPIAWPAPAEQTCPAPDYTAELFHGPHWRSLKSVLACSPSAIMVTAAAPGGESFAGNTLYQPWLLDACFQALIIWSQRQLRTPALPTATKRYVRTDAAIPKAVIIHAQIRETAPARIVADLWVRDRAENLVAWVEGCSMVVDASLRAAFFPEKQLAAMGQPSHA